MVGNFKRLKILSMENEWKMPSTKSEHSSGKGLMAVLTGLQDPSSFLELSKDTHICRQSTDKL